MKSPIFWKPFLAVQVVVIVAIGTAFLLANTESRRTAECSLLGIEPFHPINVPRTEPLRVQPLYNRPNLVSDEDLAAVLKQIRPPFDRRSMQPNHVEHALRTWGVTATFQDPNIVSGREMLEFLTDHAKYIESWGTEVRPLLEERPTGVSIRWGTETGASYHHDHWLACLTEAGAPLTTPVYGPSRTNHTLNDVLQQSLRDFRLDDRETEWTAMAFGLWIPPTRSWIGAGGRHYSFDLLCDRLMRGQKQTGVCAGTHRVYSLMLLIRLDDEFDILSDAARAKAYAYLESARDAITASQLDDGHWPSNWPDGAEAKANPLQEDLSKQVIATGHHLEWLSIAPPDLHPPEEQIKKAMDWAIRTTQERSKSEIKSNYTFFSHIGAALANWRNVHPADFWRNWEAEHPDQPNADVESASNASGSADAGGPVP